MLHHSSELLRGIIEERPNRFIMKVRLDASKEDLIECHCPATVQIGHIQFKNIPCLVRQNTDTNSKRKTNYTVEAISLDIEPEKLTLLHWVGINQNMANRYIEHFIKTGQLNDLFSDLPNYNTLVSQVKREQTLGSSRIDFQIGDNCFVEVKTPLENLGLLAQQHPNYLHPKDLITKSKSFFDRLLRHLQDMATNLNQKTKGKAILLRCHMYDSVPFSLPPSYTKNETVYSAVKRAIEAGVEFWQINLKYTEEGVAVDQLFKLNLIPKEETSIVEDETIKQNEQTDDSLIEEEKPVKRRRVLVRKIKTFN